ncbi:MAG: aminoglycoside phosphotransferase family protein [Candidatus Dormibacteraeota bacterium]|nr:aminoglycoside phosphotransferase family protein [Candidatus Dormibacteraeota bacterium]
MAARYGLRTPDARVLMDHNNTVLHLAPLPLVAKVCDVTARPAGPAALALELNIALHLGRRGAPVVSPSPELPAELHRHGDHALSFWRYQPHDPRTEVDAGAAARALLECHRALDTYRGPATSFMDRQVARTGRRLREPAALRELLPADRSFLDYQLRWLVSEIRERRPPLRLLHGDPHRGNMLNVDRRCLLIDFESVCLGPLEWDLSALPGGGAGQFADIDSQLMSLVQRLRSVCVAVWCSAHAGRSPELRRSAALHLGRLGCAASADRIVRSPDGADRRRLRTRSGAVVSARRGEP